MTHTTAAEALASAKLAAKQALADAKARESLWTPEFAARVAALQADVPARLARTFVGPADDKGRQMMIVLPA